MTKYAGSNVGFLLVGGYDLVGYATEVSPLERESLTEESHTLGDSWTENTPVGLKKGQFYQTGFYDDASAASNEAFVGFESTSRVVCIAHEGNTIGKKFVG